MLVGKRGVRIEPSRRKPRAFIDRRRLRKQFLRPAIAECAIQHTNVRIGAHYPLEIKSMSHREPQQNTEPFRPAFGKAVPAAREVCLR